VIWKEPPVAGLLLIFAAIVALAVFDVLALRFGVDSRDGSRR
jgi:hypothetical protein